MNMVPKFVPEHQQKAMFRLVPMPWHGAQISARAPTKGYIQTGAHALAWCPNLCLSTNKRLWSDWCPCPGTVPKFVPEHQQKAMFRLVPMSGQHQA